MADGEAAVESGLSIAGLVPDRLRGSCSAWLEGIVRGCGVVRS